MTGKNYRGFYILLGCLMAAALVKAFMTAEVPRIESSKAGIISEGSWEKKEVEIKGRRYGEYQRRLPENVSGEQILAVKEYGATISVFLNEEEIYSYEDTYLEKGSCWEWVRLPEDAGGKLLTLQYLKHTRVHELPDRRVFLGEKNAIVIEIFKRNFFAILWGGIVLMTGIGIILFGFVMRKRIRSSSREGSCCLALYLLMGGIWLLTDSAALQFVTGKAALINFVSFLSFMLMPYFLLRFIKHLMFHEDKSIEIICRVHLVNTAVNMILYLFHILPLHKMLPLVHILLIISIGIIFKVARQEIRIYRNKKMEKIIIGLLGFGICIGFALLCFVTGDTSAYPLLYGIGVLVLMLFLLAAGFERLKYYLLESAKAESYQKAAYFDIMTQMGNRMAFANQQGDACQANSGCIVLDINNLKKANDQYGHQEGDRLIVSAAEGIKDAFEEIGRCYRIGGDEFAIILPEAFEVEIKARLQRLEAGLAKKSIGKAVPVSVAYGYALQGDQIVPFGELFRRADENMYVKKQEMKGQQSGSGC